MAKRLKVNPTTTVSHSKCRIMLAQETIDKAMITRGRRTTIVRVKRSRIESMTMTHHRMTKTRQIQRSLRRMKSMMSHEMRAEMMSLEIHKLIRAWMRMISKMMILRTQQALMMIHKMILL